MSNTKQAKKPKSTISAFPVPVSENGNPGEAAVTTSEPPEEQYSEPTAEEKQAIIDDMVTAMQFERVAIASKMQGHIGTLLLGGMKQNGDFVPPDPKEAKVYIAAYREFAAASRDMAQAIIYGASLPVEIEYSEES